MDYWEQFYEESERWPDSCFLRHLKWKVGDLEPKDIRWLFDWKVNGRKLPSWDPEPVIKKLRTINRIRFNEGDDVHNVARSLSPGGLVKRFFICHIISPLRYPIWDQNVLIAYLIISQRQDQVNDYLSLVKDENEYQSYRTNFNQWLGQMQTKTLNGIDFPAFRRIDRSLWAMGTLYRVVLSSAQHQS